MTTFAGSGVIGSTDGSGTAASFNYPSGIAVDANGNVYVADTYNHVIRKITSSGQVSTLAGIVGSQGFTNGSSSNATFNIPTGVAVDANGNVYVADLLNNAIRKISNGVVSTVAGTGSSGAIDGTSTTATFYKPTGLVLDNQGNIFVADADNNSIRKISTSGTVSTFAGGSVAGSTNGNGTNATFFYPFRISIDNSNYLYVADSKNNLIRKISPSGDVTTLAGSGSMGSNDGPLLSATFNNPNGITVDNLGQVYISDSYSYAIRKVALPITSVYDNADSKLKVLYPNPIQSTTSVLLEGSYVGINYVILNEKSEIVQEGIITDINAQFDFTGFSKGLYIIRIGDKLNFKAVKQ